MWFFADMVYSFWLVSLALAERKGGFKGFELNDWILVLNCVCTFFRVFWMIGRFNGAMSTELLFGVLGK